MSLEKGVTRIGVVVGFASGIILGLICAAASYDYVLHNFKRICFDNAFIGLFSVLKLMGATILGGGFGFYLGYYLCLGLTFILVWIIAGFKDKE